MWLLLRRKKGGETMGFWQKIHALLAPRKTVVPHVSSEQLIRLKGGVPLPPIPPDAKTPPRSCPTCGRPLEKKGDVPFCRTCSEAWCPRCGARLFGATMTQCHHCHVAWCAGCFRIPEYYVRHRFGVSMPCCGRLGEQIISDIK